MARAVLEYNFSKIQKRFNAYEKTQAKFAGKRALTRLGKEFRGRNSLIAKSYLGKQGFKPFQSAVPFTLSSTFAIQSGLDLRVGVKDERAITKGNPAAKYLYPPIGGGSTRAYDTLFTQYLRNENLINKSDYPFAVIGSRFIKLGKNGRVSKSTYSNTLIGLGKTRDKQTKGRSKKNGKIQDARVIAFKSNKGKFKKGIYREVSNKDGSFLSPLFMFNPIPTQKPQASFNVRVKFFADKKVYKYWSQEIKKLAK